MKKRLFLPLLTILFPVLLSAQSFDFENISPNGMPIGWSMSSSASRTDNLIKRSGNYSLCVDGATGRHAMAITVGKLLYEGDTVSLKGYIRGDISTGNAVVSISLMDGPQRDNHIITKDFVLSQTTGDEWVPFELKSALCPEISRYEVFCTINGVGKVWLDDLELTIDGKPLSEAERRLAGEMWYKAADDKQFDDGSGFTLPKQLSPVQVENLNALARVWGLAKYYHPAVARGDFNMDYELFRILPKVYNATADVRNKVLLDWVNSLGTFETDRGRPNEGVSWVGDTKRFGAKLSAKLTDLSTAKRLPFHYYFRPVAGINTPDFYREEAYPNMNYSDDSGMKLLSVFRLWSAIEFFYPYRYMTDDRDKMLSEAILSMSAPEVNDKTEYQIVLLKLLYGIHDSHGRISDPERAVSNKFFTHAVPFATDAFMEGKFIVKHSFGKTDEGNLLKGDAITHINGQSAAEITEKYKYMLLGSNSNASAQLVARQVPNLTNKENVTYTVDRDGTIIEVEAKAYPLKEWGAMYMEYMKNIPPKVTYKIYDDSVAYINIDIKIEDIKKIAKECFSYPRIVIDNRGYPDDGVFDMLTQLLPVSYPIAHWRYPDPYRPGNFIEPEKGGDYYTGSNNRGNKIVVIVDHDTQSQSEYTTMMLQNIPGVVTVGSQTSGADGNCTNITLPGNVEAYFTGLDCHYPDGGRCQGVGVRIDEVVTPTLKGIREGRDELLERAIEIVKSDK